MPYADPADALRARKKHNSAREMRRRAEMGPDALRAYYRDKKRLERARARARNAALGILACGSRSQTWFMDDSGTVHEAWCRCHDCLYGPLAVRQGLLRGLAPTADVAEDGADACVRLVRDPVGVRRRSGGGHASQY